MNAVGIARHLFADGRIGDGALLAGLHFADVAGSRWGDEGGLFQIGTGVGTATQALDALVPGAVVRRNVFVGGSSAQYPRDNFEDLSFRRAGLDHTDLSVDIGALPNARV